MMYENILRRVSEISVLKTSVDKMQDVGVLNLVCQNWEQVLKNNVMFQDFENGKIPFGEKQKKTYIEMQWMKGYDANFSVLVVGSFILNKTNNDDNIHIICRECPPLEKIYNAVMRRESQEHIDAPHKFTILPCKKLFCVDCTSIEERCQKMNINMKNHWCVRKNRIFNGECVKNLLEVNVKKDFGNSVFMAIASVRIKGRYFYGEGFQSSKLFGDVVDLILFQEQALEETRDELVIDFPDSEELKTESVVLPADNEQNEEKNEEKPVDAIPRGVKRPLKEEEEWDIKFKYTK